MSTFQENLKTLRIKAGLTQGQLAAILNISRSLISHYERGKRLPKYNTLKQLCNIFNVNYDELLGNSDFSDYYKNNFLDTTLLDIADKNDDYNSK